LAAFTAYFDAGGEEHSQVALSVAGFVASAEAWIEWEREWRERLLKDGLSVFHSSDVLRQLGEVKADRLVDDLCSILRGHVSAKTGAAVLHYDVQKALPDELRDQYRITSYALCGRIVAKEMRIWAARNLANGRKLILIRSLGCQSKARHPWKPPIYWPTSYSIRLGQSGLRGLLRTGISPGFNQT
jgi:hypothetical protein